MRVALLGVRAATGTTAWNYAAAHGNARRGCYKCSSGDGYCLNCGGGDVDRRGRRDSFSGDRCRRCDGRLGHAEARARAAVARGAGAGGGIRGDKGGHHGRLALDRRADDRGGHDCDIGLYARGNRGKVRLNRPSQSIRKRCDSDGRC